MKKLLVLLLGVFLTCTSYAQLSYPRFETDSLGQKVIVLTIEQAQALDNQTDLLVLFEKLNGQLGDYDSACLKVVNDKDRVIASQEIQISTCKKDIETRNALLKNMNIQLQKYLGKIKSLESTITNKDAEIKLHLGEIKRVKKNSLLKTGIGGVVILGLITGIILK